MRFLEKIKFQSSKTKTFGFFFITDIEAQIRDIQTKKKEIAKSQSDQGVSLLDKGGFFDTDLYDDGTGKDKYEGYNTSIATNDEVEEDEDEGMPVQQKKASYTAPKNVMKEIAKVS